MNKFKEPIILLAGSVFAMAWGAAMMLLPIAGLAMLLAACVFGLLWYHGKLFGDK